MNKGNFATAIEGIDAQGGFLIPQTAYIDIQKDGKVWAAVRWLGQRVINLGARIKSFGYSKKEIHPQEAMLEAIAKYKVKR